MTPPARPFPIARSPRRAGSLARALGAGLLVLAAVGASPAGASQRPWPNGAPWPPGTVFGSAPPPDTVADLPRPWTPGDDAWVLAPAPGDSVVLRVAPFSPESLWLEAGRLRGDQRVVILDVRTDGGGTWVRVRPWNAEAPDGWVHAKQLGYEPRWEDLDTPAVARIEEYAPDPWNEHERSPAPRDSAGYALTVALGVAALADAEGQSLGGEYDGGGLVLEVEGLDYRRGVFVVAAGMGYRRFNGSPSGEYVFADRIVAPSRSRTTLGYAMAELGAHGSAAAGLRFGVLAGPVVALVHEEADGRLFSPETIISLGETSASLDRFTAGGGAAAWIGAALPDRVELGLRVRVLGLAWRGMRGLPLATDWVEHGLWHADAALTLTFADP